MYPSQRALQPSVLPTAAALIVASGLLFTCPASADETAVHHALVIGIDEYQDESIPALTTAEHDAQALADVLADGYGFETTLLVGPDATQRRIAAELTSLRRSVTSNDSVLVYFAGHGERDELGAYWMPWDALPPGSEGGEVSWMASGWIRDNIAVLPSQHTLVIADSCFAGQLISARSAAVSGNWNRDYLAKLARRKSRWVFTSGSDEPVADATLLSKEHSVFAHFLLAELSNHNEEPFGLAELALQVSSAVGNNASQTPLASPILGAGDEGGQFVFWPTGADLERSAFMPGTRAPVTTIDKRPVRPLLAAALTSAGLSIAALTGAAVVKQQYLSTPLEERSSAMESTNLVLGLTGYGLAGLAGVTLAVDMALKTPRPR